MFSLFRKKKQFFSDGEQELIVEAIRQAELKTSGEVRVFVESKCSFMDAIDRAAELFFKLEMDKTKDRNGVLVYMAMDDRQLAVFGDENIHKKVGDEYWQAEVKKMISEFSKQHFAEGISQIVNDIGESLQKFFPYDHDNDKNELPDEIVFGK